MSHIAARNRHGFLLLEVLLGIAVFGIFLVGISATLLYGQENTIAGGDRVRGTFYAARMVDAVRAMRDADFDALDEGTYGVAINDEGMWEFTPEPQVESDGYLSSITVTQSGSDTFVLTAQTNWQRGYNRSGSVLLTSYVTHWNQIKEPGNWNSVSQEGEYVDGGTPQFNDIVLSGDYAFVTSETSGGGAGLYVFDVSALNPSVVSTVSLGYAGYDLVLRGTRLYVATADPDAELQVYDSTSPASLSASDLVTSVDVEGSARLRALAMRGTTLLAGATYSLVAGQEEFYAFDASDPDVLTESDALDVSGSVNAIAVTGTSALLASGEDVAELRYADVSDPDALVFPVDEGYQASGTEDALAVDTAGSLVALGRAYGSSIEEFLLLDMGDGDGYIAPPPGPWFYNPGSIGTPASVLDVLLDPTGCYAFLVTDDSTQEVQVLEAADTLLPKVAYFDAPTGFGRSAAYDIVRDRLYLLTDTALHVLRPGAGSNACS